MHAYPNFFYSINSSLDKVYDAKKIWNSQSQWDNRSKKRIEKNDILKKKFFGKNPFLSLNSRSKFRSFSRDSRSIGCWREEGLKVK